MGCKGAKGQGGRGTGRQEAEGGRQEAQGGLGNAEWGTARAESGREPCAESLEA